MREPDDTTSNPVAGPRRDPSTSPPRTGSRIDWITLARPPTDTDLASVRRRWLRNGALALIVVCAVGAGLVACGSWWIAQREANDRLLDEGRTIVAEIVEVDTGQYSSVVVEFTADGEQFERTIHAGFFREYPRGNRGLQVIVLRGRF